MKDMDEMMDILEKHIEQLNRMLFPLGREAAVMELERKIEEAGWCFRRDYDNT